jgi:transposase-like protein
MTQKRKRRAQSERAEIVERWQQSGQSAREFAAQAGMNASLLYLWRKQAKTAARREPKTRERKPAFSELRLSTTQPPTGHIEVVARSGRVVRVHGDVSIRAFQQVLAAVEQC